MIKFNELRIVDESKLIIDISVIDSPYYENVSLDSIIIDTQDTFMTTGPSENAIYSKKIISNPDNPQGLEEEQDIIKDYRIELDSLDLTVPIDKNMFFIYILTRGNPTIDTPCGKDNKTTIGVAIDIQKLFDKGIYLLKGMRDRCNISRDLIMHILQVKALEISVATKHYLKAIEYWRILFNRRNRVLLKRQCNG